MKLRARQEIVTVPNALNLDHFDASLRSKDEARRILNGLRHAAGDEDGSPQARIVLTVANFYAYKNLVGYLDAVKVVQDRLKGVRFIILGGEGEEWASFLPKRRALGLDSVVASPGPYADAWTLLRGADLFVLPSVKEGMPWTILETMAAGVPCVVTDVGANRWMLAEAGTIVPPGDAKALAEAIVTRLADPVGSASLGRRGREIVEARFTEGAMWDATFRLLGVAHQVDPVGSGR
jgi:glycosyltransferase involved in cell wall biosynthesis